ncbi:MAG: chitobiase/beta-hexosaminidase C-terminal domain-containing protein [Lachnospiraceae bacterium]|nr:chitobiase/beta-hexosaminidase C-terminal domain-containing protein [Lachnospiraceae bacterium]
MKIRMTRLLAMLLAVTMILCGNVNTVYGLEADAGSTGIITADMTDETEPAEVPDAADAVTYDQGSVTEPGTVISDSDPEKTADETETTGESDPAGSDLTEAEPAESDKDELEAVSAHTSRPESDDTDTSLKKSDEADTDELTALNIDIDTDETQKGTGYRPMPGEKEVPVLDDDIDYKTLKDDLIEGDEPFDDELLGVADQAIGATSKDRSFPYSYIDEDEIISYLTTYYPDTRDQGDEGTCWAHSAIAMAEFNMISHGMKDKSVDFSEMHLSYWAYTQGTPGVAGDTGDRIQYLGGGNYGNSIYGLGGNTYLAAVTLMQRRGVAEESKYPYSDIVNYPNSPGLAPSTERDNTAYLKNAYMISRKNRQLVKDAILKNGLVGMSFASYNDFINDDTSSYYCPYTTDTNHAVCIVGWDDDYPKENFDYYGMKPSKNGAWLVRNSWDTNTRIDYDSYFWISYEDMSMTDVWVYEMMDPTDPDFDNNYFYDSQNHWLDYDSRVDKSANIYKVNGELDYETIQAVALDLTWHDAPKIGYTIDIYTNVDPAKGPESGQRAVAAETKGTFDLGGFYTIPLKTPVTVAKDSYYSIVVKLSDKTSVNYETLIGWYDKFNQSMGLGDNQSFIFRNGKWTDFYDISSYDQYGNIWEGNLIIHALTSNGACDGTVTIRGTDVTVTDGKKQLNFNNNDKVGTAKTLTVTAVDGTGTDISGSVSWHSEDRMVATVENGKVTAVGNGETKIYAYVGSPDNAKFRDECTVSVNLTEHSVTFNANGGSFSETDEKGEVKYYETMIKKVCTGGKVAIKEPKRANYIFNGWVKAGTGESFIPEDTEITGDMVIQAKWTLANQCEAPTISPAPGTELHKGDQIVLSGTKDTLIYYTENDTTPNTTSTLYTEPIIVRRTGQITIKAIAVKADFETSEMSEATYSVTRDIDAEWGDIIDADKNDSQTGKDGTGGPVKIPDGLWVAEASYAKSVAYTGSNITFPGLRVYHGNKRLHENVDYTVSYSNNKNTSEGVAEAKKPTITVKGKGNYTGQDKKTFEITKVSLASDNTDITVADITESTTGKAVKPAPEIYYKLDDGTSIQLKNNTDFSCAYTGGDFTTPGDHNIKVTGKGNFKGERTVKLTLRPSNGPVSISKATLTGFQAKITMDPTKTSYEQPATLKLIVNKQEVSSGCYSISYKNNTQAGTATFTATGILGKNYTGSISKTFKIEPITFNAANIRVESGFNDSVTWNTDAEAAGMIEQEPVLKYGTTQLVKGTDYELSYKNNDKAGNATMTMTGKGMYKGSFSKTFKIEAYPILTNNNAFKITETSMTGETKDYTANGIKNSLLSYPANRTSSGAFPKLSISFGSLSLTEGKDYTLSYKNNKKYYSMFDYPNTYFYSYKKYWPQVTITGKGAYKGTLLVYYNMNGFTDLSKAVVTAPDLIRSNKKSKSLFSTPVVTYNGIKLKAGTDYHKEYIYRYAVDTVLSSGAVRKAGTEVFAEDILKEGASTWINVTVQNAGGTKATGVYAVKAGSVAKATVKVNDGKPYEYTGNPVCPRKADLTVTIGKTELNATDYDIVGYSGNEKAGTAKLTIRGKGDYCGEKTQSFTIGQRKFLWWTAN